MKNQRALTLLLTANVVSGIAQGISMIAIPWFFAQNGELDFFVYFYILSNILALFWVPYNGTLVDKYNRKSIFMAINFASAIFLGIISLLGFVQGGLSLLVVASVFIFTMLGYSIHYPCLYAFVQEITPKEKYGKITSILEVQGQSTNILGGALAAVLLEGTKDGMFNVLGFNISVPYDIHALEIHTIFLIDCATYILALGIIACIYFEPIAIRKEETEGIWVRLTMGWKFLMQNKTILLFGIVTYMIFVCVMLEGFYLGALYVKEHLQASANVYASSDVAYSIGALVSGVFIRRIFKSVNIPFAITVLMVMMGVTCMALFLTNGVFIFYGALFFTGLSNAGSRILRVTYLFNNIPNQVYGRSVSIFNIANILIRIMLLSLFALPFFHIENNVIFAFLILSFTLAISVIIMIVNYRKFDLNIY